MEWLSFRWAHDEIEIRPTAHFAAKSEDSYGRVQMESAIMDIFREFHTRAKGKFVVECGHAAKAVRWNHYRCQSHFEALIQWLRAQGIQGDKPLHILRKEFGSNVCTAHGIYAASRALRHADINVTSQFYTESRSRVTAGMSHLLPLPAAEKIVEFPKETGEAAS